MSELWTLGACELARLVRAREVSARDVVQAHLDRIAEVNPALNAVTDVLAEQALTAADAADSALGRGTAAGPLTGVPMTVKELAGGLAHRPALQRGRQPPRPARRRRARRL
jgi:amidase